MKKGFVKSPRKLEYDLFGPNSPLPEKWRVFQFIKYRIQDNKLKSQSATMTREYIIENTGIWKNHFSRIITSLEKDELIEVTKGRYRDSAATYRLSSKRFNYDVIAADSKSKLNTKMVSSKSDKFVDNTKMVSENESKHQIGVGENQIGVGDDASTLKSLTESPFRSPSLDPFLNLRTPEKDNFFQKQTSAERYGLGETQFRQLSVEWMKATDGNLEFEQWLKTKQAKA